MIFIDMLRTQAKYEKALGTKLKVKLLNSTNASNKLLFSDLVRQYENNLNFVRKVLNNALDNAQKTKAIRYL